MSGDSRTIGVIGTGYRENILLALAFEQAIKLHTLSITEAEVLSQQESSGGLRECSSTGLIVEDRGLCPRVLTLDESISIGSGHYRNKGKKYLKPLGYKPRGLPDWKDRMKKLQNKR